MKRRIAKQARKLAWLHEGAPFRSLPDYWQRLWTRITRAGGR